VLPFNAVEGGLDLFLYAIEGEALKMFKRPSWMSFEKFKKKRREASNALKSYLKGKLIEGTETYFKPRGRIKTHNTKADQKSTSFLKKKRTHRNMRNKMAKRSRRINRLRSA
jgi:hypothetical protein